MLPALREKLRPLDLPAPGWHTLGELPRLVAQSSSLLRPRDGVNLLSPMAAKQREVELLGHWLTVALERFELEVRPGSLWQARCGPLSVCPARLVEDLASGALDAASYAEFAAQAAALSKEATPPASISA